MPLLYVYEPARAQRKVTVVPTANTYRVYIEIRGAYGPRYSEDTDS